MKPLIIIAGPTAVGKTQLSIDLAKRINGEIISADSMQVYRYMDIGSAKISREQMQGVRHHLIDCLDPTEPFNAFIFKKMAKQAVDEITERKKIPILVGGTGFYIQALLYDIDFEEEETNSLRENYEEQFRQYGAGMLHDQLKEIDPESARMIHPNNVKRVIRALEYYALNHEPISRHNEEERKKSSPYSFCYFVLNENREKLYRKIELRVDQMMEQGLVDEVRKLKELGCSEQNTSMQGLGYKEILQYLDGVISLEEAIYRIKRDTRHFAKRQLTWFHRERDVIWLDKENYQNDNLKMIQEMERHISMCRTENE